MKNIVLTLMLALPLFIAAQTNHQKETTDSIHYFQRQISQIWREQRDSLYRSDKMVGLMQRVNQLRSKSKDYFGFVLLANLIHTNYTTFNKSITASGFSEMDPTAFQFAFGLSQKRNRTHFDFYFFTIGLNNRSTKGNEKITSSLSNLLHPEFGYSIIQKGALDIYPYAGVSLRLASLNYSTPVQTNASYSNITNIITNNQNVRSSGNGLGYQAGLGIDLKIASSNNNTSRTMLFLKAGTNGTFGSDKYRIEGVKYEPGIKHGDWFLGIGFKFVGAE